MTRPSFCAICVEPSKDLERSTDGFWECARCRGEPATEARDVHRGYRPNDAFVPCGKPETDRRISAFAAKHGIVLDEPCDVPTLASESRAPHEAIHRVKADRGRGRWIDADDAHDLIAHEPWYERSRYLGLARGYHVFAYVAEPTVPRPPTYDGHVGCPSCGHRVGYRDIRAGMRVLAPHSEGKGRIVPRIERCPGAELNIAAEAA